MGASGLVGGLCLQELLEEERYGRVTVLTRRPLNIKQEKLEQHVVDFDRLDSFQDLIVADHVYSCLGTTRSKALSEADYRRIDLDIPREIAAVAAGRGARQLILVSSAGADARATAFYPRLKGEIEEAVAALPFKAVHIFRPSLLLGGRGERRPLEALAQAAEPLYSWLMAGPLRRYKPISASDVARAMVRAALAGGSGPRFYEFDAIRSLASEE